MATYRLSVNVIGRATGGSAVASAAYRSEEELKDEQKKMTFDYSKKNYCLHKEIIAPPETSKKFENRAYLWNEVEKCEKRKKSQVAKEFQVSLPHELKLEKQKELVKNFCKKELVSKGIICDIAIHNEKNKNKNYHAHILTTMRDIAGDSFGKKNRSWNGHNEGRDWKPLLKEYREKWEQEVNKALEKQNKQERVSCLSNKEKGLEKPKIKSLNYKTYRYFEKVANIIEKEELYEIKETKNKEVKTIFFPPAEIKGNPTFKLERTKNYFLKNIKAFLSKKFIEKIKKEILKIQNLYLKKEENEREQQRNNEPQGSLRTNDERSGNTRDNSSNTPSELPEPQKKPSSFIRKLKRSSKEVIQRGFDEKRIATREAEQRAKQEQDKKQDNKHSRSRGPRR